MTPPHLTFLVNAISSVFLAGRIVRDRFHAMSANLQTIITVRSSTSAYAKFFLYSNSLRKVSIIRSHINGGKFPTCGQLIKHPHQPSIDSVLPHHECSISKNAFDVHKCTQDVDTPASYDNDELTSEVPTEGI